MTIVYSLDKVKFIKQIAERKMVLYAYIRIDKASGGHYNECLQT